MRLGKVDGENEKMIDLQNVYKDVRVLVTGHTGFKGSWLTEWLLAMGANVTGLALRPNTNPNLHTILQHSERIDSVICDIRRSEELSEAISHANPDIVFHLAAQPLVRRSYRDPLETWSTNVLGTANVLEGVHNFSQARACIIVTSDKCYKNRNQIQGYSEVDELGGDDPYSASKAATELVTESYRKSFFEEKNMFLATVRAGNVIGGGDWSEDRIVTDIIRAHNKGAPLILRCPNAVRPWQHVLEPLSGYLTLGARLLGRDGADYAEAWNFGPLESTHATVLDLANAAAKRLGTFPIEVGDMEFHEANLLKLDSSKAFTRLGWKPQWNFEETMDSVCSWYESFYLKSSNAAEVTRSQIAEFIALKA